MRSLEESRARWEITARLATSLENLKRTVRSEGNESPCKSGLRSVCWKISLLFQTTETTEWSRALVDSRGAYASLREHLLRYIQNPNELGSALDPLDDDRNSPWNTLRQDEEMRAEIFQDIERCMPEEPYFRQARTQQTMLDILFIFCKINQDVGYRQGMHELLAPILWVVEQDAIDRESSGGQDPGSEADSLLKQTLDPIYIEHDAFTLLSLIMRTAKSFYELGEPDLKPSAISISLGNPQLGVSPIVERSERIHEVYLARVDPDLAKHLTDIEVLPQIFLIRWIRLLFGREFPFDDLLATWDILLAEDPGLDLVDMVCVAMLLRIRWQLIEANYSFALMLLLKYPSPSSPHGPQTFVDDAIYLRDNFGPAGGSEIISKYSGRSPPIYPSALRPSTPSSGEGLGHKQKLSRARSPLQSPSRFLQQQGGVEALLQGAAKGVFNRGERLGINQAVRDAVGEVRKNMQGLQSSRASSATTRTSDVLRWSLDEGRSVQPSKEYESAMNIRNLQLSRMLEQAMAGLREVSAATDSDKEEYAKAIDIAMAKVGYLKVYLEDSTMPLPTSPERTPERVSTAGVGTKPLEPVPTHIAVSNLATALDSKLEAATTSDASRPSTPTPETLIRETATTKTPSEVFQEPVPQQPSVEASEEVKRSRRSARPLPTRSSLAQSNFSWMLEPGSTSASSLKSSSPSSSPFPKTGRRPNSGSSREKSAFLFGEDMGQAGMSSAGKPDTEEGFNLGPLKTGEDKE